MEAIDVLLQNDPSLWWDPDNEFASDLLDEVDADDWERLRNEWRSMDERWQFRMTFVLGGKCTADSFDLLFRMLDSPYKEVRASAAEQLGESTDIEWEAARQGPSPELVEKIERIRQEADRSYQDGIDALLLRMSTLR